NLEKYKHFSNLISLNDLDKFKTDKEKIILIKEKCGLEFVKEVIKNSQTNKEKLITNIKKEFYFFKKNSPLINDHEWSKHLKSKGFYVRKIKSKNNFTYGMEANGGKKIYLNEDK